MRLKTKTLQASLFIKYSAFIITILLIIGFAFYSYFSEYITSRVYDQQVQLCTSIVSSLDSEVTKMNTVSMNVLYSNLLKDKYFDYLSISPIIKKNDVLLYSKNYSRVNTLIDVIMAILGPFQSVSQCNIYDFNGNMVGAGIFNGEANINVKNKTWYQKTMKMNGFKYITNPEHIQMLDPIYSGVKNHEFISLSRIYEDRNYKKLGIVEIVQDCNTLFKYINDVMNQNNDLHIYIINSEGNCIYPYVNLNPKAGNYYTNLIQKQKLAPMVMHNIDHSTGGIKEVMTYNTSDYSGWSVIIVEAKNTIFSSLNSFTQMFILFLIFVIIISLLISYIVARNVTIPLKKLRNAIKGVEIEDLFVPDAIQLPTDNNTLNEIERLNNAFNKMHENLGKSLNELLHSRNEEMNSRLLALQSQMNPHFLYNNLANISAMAEEGMTKEIVSLCGDVSYMLRYISEEKKTGIDMLHEINYTQRYLNCMKLRYEDHLIYELNFPEEMSSIRIPKLIIQPLVENSMKHGLNTNPPWHIHVEGFVKNDIWYVQVSDTGTGFSEDVLKQFDHFIENLKDISKIQPPPIGGMGLINICLRLKLLYRDDGIFLIENIPGSGARVTIGGSSKYSLEQ